MNINNLINELDIINYNKDMDDQTSYTYQLECGLLDDMDDLEIKKWEVIK